MEYDDQEALRIIESVKEEPRTVQDIARLIGRSWVTADNYLKKVEDRTGLIKVKTFRKGSHGALKVVYYPAKGNTTTDEIKKRVAGQIMQGKLADDFDCMELFQFIPENKKKVFIEEYDESEYDTKRNNPEIFDLYNKAENAVYSFSGYSYLGMRKDDLSMVEMIESLLKRKVSIKILAPITIHSITHLTKLEPLIARYPNLIEIRHCYQPLRGFIIDDKIIRLKNEESLKESKSLSKATIYYEIYCDQWISWMTKLFWQLFRSSLDYSLRVKEIRRIMDNT